MHGLGNDYVFINGIQFCPNNLSDLAIKISDRHKGIGSDGLVVILGSSVADFKMRMFNADGSEGEMCGNASRCIGKYVYEKGLTHKKHITLETLAGVRTLTLDVEDNQVKDVTVDMGEPILDNAKIPVSADKEVIMTPIKTGNGVFNITAVSIGNPHGVIFVQEIEKIDVQSIGRELEYNPIFPKRANIEFAQIINHNEIKMRVWERGSGETLACGTGACAALVAGALIGKCDRRAIIHLLGGDLVIEWNEQNNHIYMSGPAEISFEGSFFN